jgi:hypothetical protein
MILSNGTEFRRLTAPTEIYAVDINGSLVFTRLIKKIYDCVSFSLPDGKECVFPEYVKFNVAFLKDGKKYYQTFTLGQIHENDIRSEIYVLGFDGKDICIKIMDRGKREIIWPEKRFNFVDEGFLVIQ